MQGCLQSESQGAYRLTSALINGGPVQRGGTTKGWEREKCITQTRHHLCDGERPIVSALCSTFLCASGTSLLHRPHVRLYLGSSYSSSCSTRHSHRCLGWIWSGSCVRFIFKPLFILIWDVCSCNQATATAHLPESLLRSITFIFSPRQSLTAVSEIIHCASLGNTIILAT